MKQNWIIVVCNSEGNGAAVHRVNGTKSNVKKHLMNLVKEDKQIHKECNDPCDCACSKISDIEERANGEELYACVVYSGSHVDFSAIVEKDVMNL